MREKSGIFVDTSVWIDFFNKDLYADVIREHLIGNTLFSCGLVLTELMQGASSKGELRKLMAFFQGLQMLEIPNADYEQCGILQFNLRRKGITVPTVDAVIATLCISRNLLLATRDKHFSMIPGVRLVPLND